MQAGTVEARPNVAQKLRAKVYSRLRIGRNVVYRDKGEARDLAKLQ